jgi:L-ascorbate metabolism protein UlaG (beta-lactamase superfamily)
MDRFSEKQARIEQCRVEACACYPALWSQMIAEWNAPDPMDRVWLTYSANYLFRTNNIRWAIDPLTLNWRLQGAPKVNVRRDLYNLSFVLLTHEHKDHLDLDLLATLRDLPIIWVVPQPLLPDMMGQVHLLGEKVIVPSPLKPIELYGIQILPFDGLHWEKKADGKLKGVPAMGYLIECNNRRWLFPGDTRTYDAKQLPNANSLDIVFAHLWLGRASALMDKPPLLDAFCRFCLDLNPRQLILTHLNEFGRDANDFWDENHVEIVCTKLREFSGEIQITQLSMGESIPLQR